MDAVTVLCGVLILVGLVGIALPVLPGLMLVWASVLLWALSLQDGTGWVILAVATALVAGGTLLKYLIPGRRLRRAGVRTSTTLAGVVLGIIGFFLIPVVGAFIGFVLGIYLLECLRHRSWDCASTKVALRAVAVSIGIELLTALAVALSWAGGVIAVA